MFLLAHPLLLFGVTPRVTPNKGDPSTDAGANRNPICAGAPPRRDAQGCGARRFRGAGAANRKDVQRAVSCWPRALRSTAPLYDWQTWQALDTGVGAR